MKVEFHRGRAGWRWPLLIVLCLTSLGLQAQNTPDIDPALLIDEEEQVTQEELEMENIPVDERIFIEPWNEVPYNRAYFTYTDAEIRDKWDYLMRGLRMPYPSADYLRRQFEKYPFLRDGLEDFDGDFQKLERRYVNVWRHFFAGNFQTARRLGLELGPIGEIPALFAQLLYAIYLADRQSVKYMMLQDMANRTERYFDLMEPAEDDPEMEPVVAVVRLGYAYAIARIAEQAGIQALAIHGRTRADKFNGEAEFHTVRDVVAAVGIPVIANGDINSPQKAQRILETTGASGIMIGRAAQGNPWIFQDTVHYLDHGRLPPAPKVEDVAARVLAHLIDLHRFYGDYSGVRIARKHLGWYTQHLPGGEDFRRGFNKLEKAGQQRRAIEQFFQQISALGDRIRIGGYGEVSARNKDGALAA